MWRKARSWCCSHALYCFLPQRALTRSKTATTRCTKLASSHRGGIPVVRRRSSSNARSARLEVRTYCRCRAGTLRWYTLASGSSARPRHASGKVVCYGCRKGCQRRWPSASVGASRLSPPSALHAGQAWGGTCCLRCCLLGNHQRIRSARGHILSTALLSPGAPSVVSVTGVGSPRFRRSRRTARPRA